MSGDFKAGSLLKPQELHSHPKIYILSFTIQHMSAKHIQYKHVDPGGKKFQTIANALEGQMVSFKFKAEILSPFSMASHVSLSCLGRC